MSFLRSAGPHYDWRPYFSVLDFTVHAVLPTHLGVRWVESAIEEMIVRQILPPLSRLDAQLGVFCELPDVGISRARQRCELRIERRATYVGVLVGFKYKTGTWA
eukprot:scaffold2419_cov114-Isochrysis_galbana.AAC.15